MYKKDKISHFLSPPGNSHVHKLHIYDTMKLYIPKWHPINDVERKDIICLIFISITCDMWYICEKLWLVSHKRTCLESFAILIKDWFFFVIFSVISYFSFVICYLLSVICYLLFVICYLACEPQTNPSRKLSNFD